MALIAQRCWNVMTIYEILHNPVVWSSIAEDAQEDFFPDVINDQYVCLVEGAQVIGCYRFNKLSKVMWQIHAAILPEFRDRYAKESGKTIIKWFLKHIKSAEKLICVIPEIYPLVKRFAEMGGFKEEGFNRKSFLKDGHLIGQFYLGALKEELKIYVEDK